MFRIVYPRTWCNYVHILPILINFTVLYTLRYLLILYLYYGDGVLFHCYLLVRLLNRYLRYFWNIFHRCTELAIFSVSTNFCLGGETRLCWERVDVDLVMYRSSYYSAWPISVELSFDILLCSPCVLDDLSESDQSVIFYLPNNLPCRY